MDLDLLLTIVIPCKNEKKIVETTLDLLNKQNEIQGVKVYVSDSSTDHETTFRLENRTNDIFSLYVIQGGLPSIARNKGALKSKTPYVLFLDADIFLLDKNLIVDSIRKKLKKDLDLLTIKFRTTNGKYNFAYKLFEIIQSITKPFGPIALGGFMMFKKKTFDCLGGFDETAKVAEDYLLSRKIKGNKFKVLNNFGYTTPRRFEKKGIFYMVKLMVQSFLFKNNKSFFSQHNTYWK
jgi:glycosyltransferase involved in cell wall biosynthesis